MNLSNIGQRKATLCDTCEERGPAAKGGEWRHVGAVDDDTRKRPTYDSIRRSREKVCRAVVRGNIGLRKGRTMTLK